MEMIRFSDCTLQQTEDSLSLSFREKLELCKHLDRLNLSAVEFQPIRRQKADSLLIKSVCSAVGDTTIVVPVLLSEESVSVTWNALRSGRSVRLQVRVPVSSVQMEYLAHLKPAALLSAVERTLRSCLALTDQVEFVAEDATRADSDFLNQILSLVLSLGVPMITLQDAAGSMLPEEVSAFFASLYAALPALETVALGFDCHSALNLADACAVAAIRSGVRMIKGTMLDSGSISIAHVARVLEAKGSEFGAFARVNTAQLRRIASQIESLCRSGGNSSAQPPREGSGRDIIFTPHDTQESIRSATVRLGYDLSDEDAEKIWSMFQAIAGQKGQMTLHELDALIAAEAMQVPPAYTDVRFTVNTASSLGAMAHMRISFRGQELRSTAAGDGVIDAAFHAIEQAIGRHLELDDFQIQTVTEGREAMGEALVKLRSDGRLFSGRSVSTDIVGASIMAYISALNKIVFEEDEA